MAPPGRPAPDDPDFFVSVNLSPLQVQRPEFIGEIEGVVEETGLAPSRLVLELTETSMFQDTQATITKLQALRERGVRIAVDDFGTGYSSLGYLRQFPVDILKIAREFVVPADCEVDEWAFAHAIVALGQTLGLQIVAEGIERSGPGRPAPRARLRARTGLPFLPPDECPRSGHHAHDHRPASSTRPRRLRAA